MTIASACLGIDHSKWQWGKPMPWKALREKDVLFSIAKCTQNQYLDPFFKRAHYEAGQEGFVRGVYTWLMPDGDVIAAADFFCETVEAAGGFKDVIVCVDFEETKTVRRGPALIARCEEFCRRIEEQCKKPIRLYTGTWYMVGYAENADSEYLASRALWHAQYPHLGTISTADYRAALEKMDRYTPAIPLLWNKRGLSELFFQFDGDGGLHLPNGVDADFNIFRGSKEQLIEVAAETLAPKAPYKPEILDARTYDPLRVDEFLATLADNASETAAQLIARKSGLDVDLKALGASLVADNDFMRALMHSA